MVYPIPNFTRVWVRGKFVDLAKAAREETSYGLTGPVQFIPTPAVTLNSSAGQVIDMMPFVVFPSPTDGYFAVQLPATDDPDINPADWTYEVVEPTGRRYHIVVPYDTPTIFEPGDPLDGEQVIDLANVVPNPDANPGTVQLLVGQTGRGIESVAFVGSDLVVTMTDAEVINVGPFGEIGFANLPTGTAANEVAVGNHGHAYAPTSHSHAATDLTTDITAAQLPIVPWVISSTAHSVSGALATDANSSGGPMLRKITMTANITSVSVPTDPTDGQVIRFLFFASGGTRTVTFDSSIRTSTGLTRGTHSIPSGEVMEATIEYSTLIGAWFLTAYTITAV